MTTDPKPSEGMKPRECPFCGKQPKTLVAMNTRIARCEPCGLAKPIEVWNTRPDPDRESLLAQLAAKDEALRSIAMDDIFDDSMRQIARAALSPDSGNEVMERLKEFEGKANAWDAVYSEVSVLPQYQESLREYREGGNHSAAVAFKLFIQGILAQRDTALAELAEMRKERDALKSKLR